MMNLVPRFIYTNHSELITSFDSRALLPSPKSSTLSTPARVGRRAFASVDWIEEACVGAPIDSQRGGARLDDPLFHLYRR